MGKRGRPRQNARKRKRPETKDKADEAQDEKILSVTDKVINEIKDEKTLPTETNITENKAIDEQSDVSSESDDGEELTEKVADLNKEKSKLDSGDGSSDENNKGKERNEGDDVLNQKQIESNIAELDTALNLKKDNNIITSDGRYRNKQRCLILCSRGVTARYRHLLEDLRTLIPHHKKDSKLDPGKSTPASRDDGGHGAGGVGRAVNEICEVRSCNSFLFLECKKRGQDAYLYMGYSPNGPSAKFHLANVHTMDELRLTGNCMKGSRPILTFDDSFGKLQHLKLLKTMFIDIFGIPRGHPKSKPFVDRVMGFYFADNKIWVRNYQIQEEQASNSKEAAQIRKAEQGKGGEGLNTSLIEIGPRFVLNPIRIFSGSFWGQTLYQNSEFVSPSTVRSNRLRQKGDEYKTRKDVEVAQKRRKGELVLEKDPLDSVFR